MERFVQVHTYTQDYVTYSILGIYIFPPFVQYFFNSTQVSLTARDMECCMRMGGWRASCVCVYVGGGKSNATSHTTSHEEPAVSYERLSESKEVLYTEGVI